MRFSEKKIALIKSLPFLYLFNYLIYSVDIRSFVDATHRWWGPNLSHWPRTRMPFHCLVYTGRYIGPTRALIKWRWTLATMIMLYSINLLHQLFEENDLVSFERSVQKLCLFLHIYFAIIYCCCLSLMEFHVAICTAGLPACFKISGHLFSKFI